MASRLDDLTQQRLDKLERIKNRGIDPYPRSYKRTHTAEEAKELLKNNEDTGIANPSIVSIAGRIMAIRKMGKSSFLDLQDGSSKIQIIFTNTVLGDEDSAELYKDLDIGDFIGVKGGLMRTRTGEPTVHVEEFELLSKSLLPLPEKYHGLQDVDARHRQRYLDLISNQEVKDTFRMRSRIIAAIRNYLNTNGFLEVETPVLQPSAGGALARPFITHHHALDCDFYLRIALELHLKRLIVGGFDKVYELGRIFRNEGLSIKHNPEFTMLESYQAYADYKDVMDMLEDMVSSVIKEISGNFKFNYGDNIIDFTPPWQRLDLRETILKYSGIDFLQYPDVVSLRNEMMRLDIEIDPAKDRGRLIDELLSTFVEPHLIQPTILYDYPLDMSPLAKKKPGYDNIVERFEAYVCGMELANAFSEINDSIDQRQRFVNQHRSRGKDEEQEVIDEDFLTAMAYGMPPTGGLGVGIDRLVMLLTNQQSIREVILFPQLREKE
ncbi:MAG TPA: lysine--tRNA ligase [Dehalococcoidia bacterium]|nr:lysine--tRNA ligase [Dehalococcoidia bacterium]HAS27944.1 lysine--tRNA ligase [Dehalococcoidia bacterium]